jgi:flavin-binding protein dodecin
MARNKTYKKVEIVGTSDQSVSNAIENAIDKADESIQNLDWFEVDEIRGGLQGQGITYQVTVEIGFRLE